MLILMLSLNALVLRQWDEFIIDQIEEQPLDMKKIEEMPGMTVYIVKPKDTLWDIAKRFYTTVDEITRVNELTDQNIRVGQPLLLVKQVKG